MAELTIRLVIDPATGKKNVVIAYQSDQDALPMEHEAEHRRLVDRLIEGGALSAAEVGTVVIERDTGEPARSDEGGRATEAEEVATERQSVAQKT